MSDTRGLRRSHQLSEVTAALGTHSGSVADIARTTGMSTEETMAALTTLASIGRVRLLPLTSISCPDDGCGSCGSRVGCPLTAPGGAADLHVWQVQPR